jgi:hypothetical protein
MEDAVLVAKMTCNFVERSENHPGDEVLHMHPVYSDEGVNKQWSEATPAGALNLVISNPGAQGKVEQGKEYLVYIVPCPQGE